VQLVCTPRYTAPGCEGARYSSALVVAADSAARSLADLRGSVCAINARDSHSGCNVLRRMLAPLATGGSFFTTVIETGSHTASLGAVAGGRAALCAVDAVTHALLARHAPEWLAGTRVLELSPQAPGLPYIAGLRAGEPELESMRAAIHSALEDPGLASTRDALLIDGAEVLPLVAYEEIVKMEREAVAMGYPALR
jgi:ABC-type phosphate/phosphonate transport system substrate-binding protein